MLKIANVSHYFPPDWGGGAVINLSRICLEQSKRADVSVFCGRPFRNDDSLPDSFDYFWKGIKVRSVKFTERLFLEELTEREFFFPEARRLFADFLRERKPDIVHFHSLVNLGADLIIEAKSQGIPTVLKMPDWWWFCPRIFLIHKNGRLCPYYNEKNGKLDLESCDCFDKKLVYHRQKILRKNLEAVDRIVVPSQYLKRFLIHNNIQANRVVVTPNGVRSPDKSFAKMISPRRNVVRFGYVGGYGNVLKGYQLLHDVFKEIARSKTTRCWELELWGSFPDELFSPFFQEFEKTIAVVRGDPEIELLLERQQKLFSVMKKYYQDYSLIQYDRGKIIDLPIYNDQMIDFVFAGFDLLLVPSLQRESFNSAVREALIRGIPVISTRNGGAEEVIQHEVNGLLFDYENPKELKKTVLKVLHDPDFLTALKKGAMLTKIDEISDQAANYFSIYENVLNKSIPFFEKQHCGLAVVFCVPNHLMEKAVKRAENRFKIPALIIAQNDNLERARKLFLDREVVGTGFEGRFDNIFRGPEIARSINMRIDRLVIPVFDKQNWLVNVYKSISFLDVGELYSIRGKSEWHKIAP